jgi:RNA polymerase sigma factor (sigma-70 family)
MTILRENVELRNAFREGRPYALAEVYREQLPRVVRYLRFLSRKSRQNKMYQSCLVDDLAQEVFIRAFSDKARYSFNEYRDFGPYLVTIAKHLFLDATRRRRREEACELEMDSERLYLAVQEQAPVSERPVDPRVAAVVRAYLRELPEELSRLYERRFLLEESQELAASTLGISRGQLRSLEQRLKRGLGAALRRAGVPWQARRPSRPPVRWRAA